MIGRLSAAYEENGGRSLQTNLFASRSVSMYLRKVKDGQAKARGYEHKKRKRPATTKNSTSTSPVLGATRIGLGNLQPKPKSQSPTKSPCTPPT
ncbi:hypothetical protein IFM89_024919 [Coptis chinensis]|uniref:ALOG domain-containing protein n=1 Tax=Coptis chinensis TaxID=261450 RepID=A0A835H6V0_9MAGN|nr:hypothetical protein IFM89_024919 [Coptis chinensis]